MASFAHCPQFRFHCAFNQQLMHSYFPIRYYSQICLACEQKTALSVCVWCMYVCVCFFFLQCCDIRNNGCLVIMNQSRVFVLACVTCNMSFALAEIDSVKLARLIFNKLCETCCQWLKEFPYRRRHLPYYETSIHAIKNMRRKMEDKHVVIPDFNTLFNLQVWPWSWLWMTFCF